MISSHAITFCTDYLCNLGVRARATFDDEVRNATGEEQMNATQIIVSSIFLSPGIAYASRTPLGG